MNNDSFRKWDISMIMARASKL